MSSQNARRDRHPAVHPGDDALLGARRSAFADAWAAACEDHALVALALAEQRGRLAKVAFEPLFAALVLIVACPLLLLVALAIRLDSPGHPLFVQERIGQWGRPFRLLKFRTLHTRFFGVFFNEELRDDDHRVTRVGRFLRRTKLDEIPQLINVIAGQMSLVGPRPDIPQQVVGYSPDQRIRLAVKPGLTGLAQVSGNTWLTWAHRILLDVWYIRHWSLALDARILCATLRILVEGERIHQDPLGLRHKVLTPCSPDLPRS